MVRCPVRSGAGIEPLRTSSLETSRGESGKGRGMGHPKVVRWGESYSVAMETRERFEFRYDRWCGWLLGLLGSGRRFSRVIVSETVLDVQLGMAFRGNIPTSSIQSARQWTGRVLGWGAHGWRGRWLVNGSSTGIVVLEVDPPARAKVLGFPVRVRELALSMEDSDGLCEALGVELTP